MRRSSWSLVVGVLAFAGCQQKAPELPGLYLDIAKPMIEGRGYASIALEEFPDASVRLRVFEGQTEVLNEQPTVSSWGDIDLMSISLDAGVFTARLEAVRDGEVIAATTSAEFRVFPAFSLTHRLPVRCQQFTPLDAEGTQFDCDGDVIDADGGWVLGRLHGDSRVVAAAGGPIRWVRGGDGLIAELPPQWSSNGIAIPAADAWAAGSDFAVVGGSLAMLDGGSLSLVEFDSRGFVDPLAAVSREGRRAILYGAANVWDRFGGQVTYTSCLLEFDVKWRVTECPTITGVFVRQEARDGRLLFQLNDGLAWVDPMDPSHPVVVRPLLSDERYTRGGRVMGIGSASYVTLTRAESLNPIGVLQPFRPLPDGGVNFSLSINASSDSAWGTTGTYGGDIAETYWEPLP